METRQTAVQKLSEIIDNMIYKSLLHPQDKADIVGYQVATTHIKKYIDGLLAMEKEQIKDAYLEASKQTCWSYGEDPPSDDNIYAEDYYNKTYANDTTTGLPEEDSKRRGWHY